MEDVLFFGVEELDGYYKGLESAYRADEECIKKNNDRVHNSVIMCFMLNNMNSIKMFCGEMSVFRNSFYDHIKQDRTDGKGDEISTKLKDGLAKALDNFLSKPDSSLQILLENKLDLNNSIDFFHKDFFKKIQDGRIRVSYLGDELEEKEIYGHMTIGDTKMYRMENDKLYHSADCIFNREGERSKLSHFFNHLLTYSTEISVPN